MVKRAGLSSVILAVLLVPGVTMASPGSAVFQFEVLGASGDWIVVRENIPASREDTAACSYPGLDPSEFVGATVHFYPLTAEAKRGRLAIFEQPESSTTLYARGQLGEGCTSTSDAARLWGQIVAHAKSLGIEIATTLPVPEVLGKAVPAGACLLTGSRSIDEPPCREEFKRLLKKGAIRIVVSLEAIPEAPDLQVCQYMGHRFGAAVQVAGLGFGETGSGVAPGGFASHYDCRSQQFDPLRLYVLDGVAVLLGGFSGTNIADRKEYPFVIISPTRRER